jgi:hypothetical protein
MATVLPSNRLSNQQTTTLVCVVLLCVMLDCH